MKYVFLLLFFSSIALASGVFQGARQVGDELYFDFKGGKSTKVPSLTCKSTVGKICTDGRVGLGIDAPESILHVRGAGATLPFIDTASSADSGFELKNVGVTQWKLMNDFSESNTFTLENASAQLVLGINQSGNIVVGSGGNYEQKFNVNGDVRFGTSYSASADAPLQDPGLYPEYFLLGTANAVGNGGGGMVTAHNETATGGKTGLYMVAWNDQASDIGSCRNEGTAGSFLVTIVYSGVTYFALKWTTVGIAGGMRPHFTGHITGVDANTFSVVNAGVVSGEVLISNCTAL